MKIAIVTPVFGSVGGMGRVPEEYAMRLGARGHEVTVFCPSAPPTKLGQYQFVSLKPRLRYGHGAWVSQLTQLLADFSLVHFQYPFLGGARAVTAWRRGGHDRKLVVTYHMDLVGRGIFRPVFRAYQKHVLPTIVRTADRVLVSSRDYVLAGDLGPFGPQLGERLIEVPFGVDIERFAPREPNQALLAELKIPADASVVLFVGGLNRAHYFKGIPTLLRAFSILRRESEHVRLVLVGSGDLLAQYRSMARKLGLVDSVIFAPRVSSEELPRYYGIADVSVLPSEDRSEAFGLVLLEAQASGVPVIATDLPGVRTVFEDGKTGIRIPPKNVRALFDALSSLLTHPEERAKMGRAARARIEERYQWELVIDQLERVYQGVG